MNITEIRHKLNRVAPHSCLRWYFFPWSFVAELNVERLILHLEMNESLIKKVDEQLEIALVARKEILQELGLSMDANLIFDANHLIGDGYNDEHVKNRKRVRPMREKAFNAFKEISKIVHDNKVFDYCS